MEKKITLVVVDFQYDFCLLGAPLYVPGSDRGGEEDEVEAIGWIPLDSIDKYQWAFDHDKIIREFAEWMHLEDGDLDMEDIDLDPV